MVPKTVIVVLVGLSLAVLGVGVDCSDVQLELVLILDVVAVAVAVIARAHLADVVLVIVRLACLRGLEAGEHQRRDRHSWPKWWCRIGILKK